MDFLQEARAQSHKGSARNSDDRNLAAGTSKSMCPLLDRRPRAGALRLPGHVHGVHPSRQAPAH
eukprot:9799631-Prorocentrum_lima.AAC.1